MTRENISKKNISVPYLKTIVGHKLIDHVFFECLNFIRLLVNMFDNLVSYFRERISHNSSNFCGEFYF